MKKILLIFLCVFAFASVHADITWELSDDGTLTISGTNMPDYSHSEAPWFSQLIKKVEIKNGVTNIGDGAFDDQYCLTSITIPNSVTSIGKFAFSGCSGLTSINIPNSVTSIGDYVFDHCYSLTSITVEKGNTKYDSRDNCNAIIETSTNTLIVGCKNTIIPNSVTSIASKAFCGSGLTSITIPNSVTNIGDYAFSGCNFLTSISLPNSVTSIGNYVFQYCYSLISITIPNTVTSIGIAAFGECSSLASITIPNSVNSIGITAFYGCESLTSITIPNSVTSIGSGAFERCSNLTSVTNLSATPQSISYYTFSKYGTLHVLPGCIEAYQKAEYWKNFTIIEDAELPNNKIYYTSSDGNIVTPARTDVFGANIVSNIYENGQGIITFDGDVTSIGSNAFVDCSGLTSITIPNSVTNIEDYAFAHCSGLTSITIPNSVTSIGDGAFNGCNVLTSIAIPNSVESIGEDAFSYCSGLTSIIVEKGNTKYDSRDNCNAIIETSTNTLIAGFKTTVIPNSVTRIGSKAFYSCGSLTSITIPNSVTSIGDYSFYYCYGLTSITIPNSVTNIEDYAFAHCSGLTSITIPNSVTSIGDGAFQFCENLTSINIPNSVTSIGDGAFRFCENLTSITIPNSVTSIGGSAFFYCNLTSVTNLSTTPQSISSNTFSKYGILHVLPDCKEAYQNAEEWKNFTIIEDAELPRNKIYYTSTDENIVTPSRTNVFGANIISNTYENGQGIITFDGNVAKVGPQAFYYCSGLTSITIPTVASIEHDAFSGCSNLTSVTIPNFVTSIESAAFSGCSGLTSVTIPNSVTSIGDYSFYYCYGLTSITIPNSVTSIGNNAFSSCFSLTSIVVDTRNTNYDSRDNCNAIIETSTNTLLFACKKTIIPNSVTRIGDYAFARYSDLTSITIPNSVTSIGRYAFQSCSNLTSVTIPNSVTSIGEAAFSRCLGLTSITIPNSVTSIGVQAFYECSGLTSITIPNSVTSIGSSAFEGCSNLTSVTNLSATPQSISYYTFEKYGTLHVLPGCKEAYENAEYWKNFTIVEDAVDPFTTIVLVDGETYSEGTTQENKNINYTRTFNNTSWQALYIPFSMSYEDWKDDFEVAFINSVRQYDNDEDGIVDETIMDVMKIKSGSLIPNTPYLIKAKSVGEKTITINNATLYKAEENSIECSTMLAKYTFTGTYSTIPASTMSANNYYAMGGGSLIMTDGTSDLKPFRWYLNIESRSPMYSVSNAAKTITINVVGEEEATGISQMSSDKEHSSAIYDLNGRRMSQKNLKSGLYIKNGKKIIIK